ncbi:MAG: ATP-binding protein [Siculibacillus sp.]|nr:ATP-binding protein [Siculibacillus sp.]
MQASSLARRLFLLAALWSALSLAVAGFVLITVYRGSVERSFDERLAVYLKTLVGALATQADGAGTFRQPDNLGEARFELPLSGWYWVVRHAADGRVALTSPSLTGEVLRLPSDIGTRPDRDRVMRAYLDGPDGQNLRMLEREVDFDGREIFRLAVAGNAGDLEADVSGFSWRTALLLAVVGLGLAISTVVQVRLGLTPLARMRDALMRIRAGEAERLEGAFPAEIAPLADELNALIQANREATERARTHVGNLAHALKTPISVLLNEARGSDCTIAPHVVEQVGLMREHVEHHLERARLAAQRRVIGVVTDVAPVIERLARAMRRIHDARLIELSETVEAGIRFRGEREDLEEALGNLVDNACKWAEGRVEITVRMADEVAGTDRHFFVVLVDDDGPGIDPAGREEALKRGHRLDQKVPGSGLGLSIVNELAALYGGEFDLERSPLGGLRCRLVLPAL